MNEIERIKKLLEPFVLSKEKIKSLPDYLYQNLTMDMSARNIGTLLAVIESINVIEKGLTFGDYIKKKNKKVLDDFTSSPIALPSDLISSFKKDGAENTKFSLQISEKNDTEFFKLMEDIHPKLVLMLDKMLNSANNLNRSHFYQRKLSTEEIDTNIFLKGLEEDSKKPKISDKTDISVDVSRNLVELKKATLADDKVVFKALLQSEDPKVICKQIEELTEDLIETPGSKANKIFNFGGQAIDGSLLNAFTSITEYRGSKASYMINKSNSFEWHKLPNGKMEAKVILDIFSIFNDNGEIYLCNSTVDGLQKVKTTNESGKKAALKTAWSDLSQKPWLRAPLASIEAKVEPVSENNQYHLKVTEYTISYYVPELRCTLDEQLKESFVKTNIAKMSDITAFTNLLQSCSNKQWLTFLKYIESQKTDTESVKLAKIIILHDMYNPQMGRRITALKNQYTNTESKFNKHYDKALNELDIKNPVRGLTDFFKNLKTNNPELCLQDIIPIINKLIKNENSEEDIKSKLIYFLRQVNKKDFALTIHDLNKIEKLNIALQALMPNNQIAILFNHLFKALYALNENLHKKEFISKNFKEISLQAADEQSFVKTVLLTTEARIHLSRIAKSRKLIKEKIEQNDVQNEEDRYPKKQRNALTTFDKNLEKTHKEIVNAIGIKTVTPDFLIEKLKDTHRHIDTAEHTIGVPTSFLQKLFQTIKSFFEKKRPSILDILTTTKIETPDQVTFDYPKLPPKPKH